MAMKAALPASIANRWRELNGEKNWKGLFGPHELDLDLRYNIILYGEMPEAICNTMIMQTMSPLAGLPRYNRKNFLGQSTATLGQASLYDVRKYIYVVVDAPPTDKFLLSYLIKSLSPNAPADAKNWMAFVAVATDDGVKALGRRDILVAWRGTVFSSEWEQDSDFVTVPADPIFPSGGLFEPKVHRGFHAIYTYAREELLKEITKLVDEHKNEEVSITVTGHSLGSALATLTAADIAANGFNKANGKAFPVASIVLASPRVGNIAFCKAFDGVEGLHQLRVTNNIDLVPNIPPPGLILQYEHVGVELRFKLENSPYLKKEYSPLGQLLTSHNLEGYCHGIAGTHGIEDNKFELVIDRDIALLNKGRDALDTKYLIPAEWWTDKNKSMVKTKDGRWVLDEYHEDDDNKY